VKVFIARSEIVLKGVPRNSNLFVRFSWDSRYLNTGKNAENKSEDTSTLVKMPEKSEDTSTLVRMLKRRVKQESNTKNNE
jgi:hypothetical protein